MDIPGCLTGTQHSGTDAIAWHRVGPTNQRGSSVRNPDTVNMIYTAVSVGHRYDDDDDRDHLCARIRFPRIFFSRIQNLPTYSLFYRSRKDVRQLKDSLDLLRGCAGVDSTVDAMRRLSNSDDADDSGDDGDDRRVGGWFK